MDRSFAAPLGASLPGLLAGCLLAHLALAAPATPAKLDPATWQGDARFLVAEVDSIHPRPYRWHRRAEWDSAAASLEERLPALRYDQAVADFSRMIGMLRDGHSRLDQVQLASHTRPTLAPLPGPGFDTSYPLECEVFADGLWIVRTTIDHQDLLGAHVIAIAGRAAGEAVVSLAPLIPADNGMWTLYMLPVFLRSPGYVSAAGLGPGPSGPLSLTVLPVDGVQRNVELAPARVDSTTRWISADAGVCAPLPLTRRLGPLAFADLGDSAHTVFARIRQIMDLPGQEGISRFVERLFAHVDSIGSRRLILDLRGNGGGDGYLNQPLVHAVIRRPVIDRTGGLFVIVDRGTFSAAVALSADLQRETHALFVGEPTGGAPNSPGDPTRVTLPASGLVVRISTVLWQGSDPRDPRQFIAPDLPAMPTWADWMAHRDPALAAILAYVPPRDAPEVPPNTHWGRHPQIDARLPKIAW
jgi:hypothetical protein